VFGARCGVRPRPCAATRPQLGKDSQKLPSILPLYGPCTGALTFENFLQSHVALAPPLIPIPNVSLPCHFALWAAAGKCPAAEKHYVCVRARECVCAVCVCVCVCLSVCVRVL
jgi:hypothetical protein